MIMRGALWLAFLFAVAVVVGLFANSNAGHVIVYFPPYRIDTSLNLFLGAGVAIFIASLLAWRTFAAILDLPKQAAAYRRKQREARAMSYLTEAVEDIFAGRFAKALKAAEAASANSAVLETAALLAARAAHRLGEIAVRDRWLDRVTSAQRQQARLVAAADMQMESNDPDGALQTIEQLQQGGARQIFVQRIALRANQQLNRWEEVLRLAHSLIKRDALHPVLAKKTVQEAVGHLVDEKANDQDALLRIWKNLPKEDRKISGIVAVIAKGFVAGGKPEVARELIEESLDSDWDPTLLNVYSDCALEGVGAIQMIQALEKWQLQHPMEPAIYLALGKVCLTQQLWGKAKSSLESVTRDSRAKSNMKALAHMHLAQLHESLQEPEKAAEQYRLAAHLYSSQ
jgi:HemY protein